MSAALTKLDWPRDLKPLYSAGRSAAIIEVPPMRYLAIDGHGDPATSPDFAAAIQALYAVAYGLKFALKRGPAGIDAKVMPLEALWWSDDMAGFLTGDRATWQWTALIGLPDAASEELVHQIAAETRRTKVLPALSLLRILEMHEGICGQILHLGPYAAEAPTIAALHAFLQDHGYVFDGRTQKHHEIYLGDPRRSAPEKLRTIIRQPVERG